MAHEVESMAYVGEVPWHGLGVEVPEDISVDDMLVRAGLDWGVHCAPMNYETKGGKFAAVSNFRALYRDDSGDVLDITGMKYIPTQNREVLEFFREYVEAGNMALHTAGSLRGGRVIWALAKMDESFTLPGKDKTEGFVLLANPHQYGKGMTVKFTPVRVVCHNTLTMALSKHESGDVKLWHTKSFDEGMRQEAARRLGIAREWMSQYGDEAKQLSKATIAESDTVKLLTDYFGNPALAEDEQPKIVQELFTLTKTGMGAGMKSANGTLWGVFNAYTEYVDHRLGKDADTRINASWFGLRGNQKIVFKDHLLKLAA